MPPTMEFYTQSIPEHREHQIDSIFSSHPFFLTHSWSTRPLSQEEMSASWELFVQLLLLGHRKSIEQTDLQNKLRSHICKHDVFLKILDHEIKFSRDLLLSQSFFENLIAVLLIREDFQDNLPVLETIDQTLNQADCELERLWTQNDSLQLGDPHLETHYNTVDIVENHLFLLKEDLEINHVWNKDIAQFFKDLDALRTPSVENTAPPDHQLKELMLQQKIKIFPLMKWQRWIKNDLQSIAALLKSHVYTKTMMAFAAAESRIEILPTLRLWANDETSVQNTHFDTPSELSLTIHNGALFLQWLGEKEVADVKLDDTPLKSTSPPSYLYDLNFRWWYLSHNPGHTLALTFLDGSLLTINISKINFPHS